MTEQTEQQSRYIEGACDCGERFETLAALETHRDSCERLTFTERIDMCAEMAYLELGNALRVVFPEITTGDVSPAQQQAAQLALQRFARQWYAGNRTA